MLANFTQHDAVWILIILGIVVLLLIIFGKWRPWS